jgi:WD40 repeat protein
VNSAAFSPDGERIVTASADKTARLWDAETGEQIGEPLTAQAFSPDGKRIVTASADKTARLWNVDKPIGELLQGHESYVLSTAFSPDGKRIVTVSQDEPARVWDAETVKPIGEPLRGHADRVWAAAFSPDGERIVTASADKTARLWDAETGEQIDEPLTAHEDAGKTADAETGEPLSHEDGVWAAAFSPDGERIVTASADKTARLWDAETGEQIGGRPAWRRAEFCRPTPRRAGTSPKSLLRRT